MHGGCIVVVIVPDDCTEEAIDIVDVGRDGLAGGAVIVAFFSSFPSWWLTFGFNLRSTAGASDGCNESIQSVLMSYSRSKKHTHLFEVVAKHVPFDFCWRSVRVEMRSRPLQRWRIQCGSGSGQWGGGRQIADERRQDHVRAVRAAVAIIQIVVWQTVRSGDIVVFFDALWNGTKWSRSRDRSRTFNWWNLSRSYRSIIFRPECDGRRCILRVRWIDLLVAFIVVVLFEQ